MKKNYTIFLGLAAIGGAAYYFVNSTKSKSGNSASDESFVPPASSNTKANPVKIALTTAQALKDNENAFIYNAKIVWLNSLLKVANFQLIIDKYTLNTLALFYNKLTGKYVSVSSLPYGEPNKGNIDKYIKDLLLNSSVRSKLG
jgi:hypothetical protein